jgi:hypothetical protein
MPVEAPRFRSQISRQSTHEVGKVSPTVRLPLLLRKCSWYSFFRDWVYLMAEMRLEGLYQWKIPVTTLVIETATFLLVAQCLNRCATTCPHSITNIHIVLFKTSTIWIFYSSYQQLKMSLDLSRFISLEIIIISHIISYEGEIDNKWNMSCVKGITVKTIQVPSFLLNRMSQHFRNCLRLRNHICWPVLKNGPHFFGLLFHNRKSGICFWVFINIFFYYIIWK